MKEVFIVLGYGIPKDILRDNNYRRYLPIAFNTIYSATQERGVEPVVVFSGGRTDMFKPYRRTEAVEMAHFSRTLLKKLFPKERKLWKLYAEKRSLSTMENLLYTKELLKRNRVPLTRVMLFCEATRERRVHILAKKLLAVQHLRVVPVDFDLSSNRYLDPAFLREKEERVLRFDVWALKNPENFKKYHSLFREKIAFLRSQGTRGHAKAVERWWRMKLKKIDELGSL
jgi:uncharacterized SAM-binding protein YcdF (DUF218 family)